MKFTKIRSLKEKDVRHDKGRNKRIRRMNQRKMTPPSVSHRRNYINFGKKSKVLDVMKSASSADYFLRVLEGAAGVQSCIF